jgi:poly-beta-hydroxyalkanoate depolymerase
MSSLLVSPITGRHATPFRHNSNRRHHIGKMKIKVTDWPDTRQTLGCEVA